MTTIRLIEDPVELRRRIEESLDASQAAMRAKSPDALRTIIDDMVRSLCGCGEDADGESNEEYREFVRVCRQNGGEWIK